ncbi:hypothetical protein [Alicyclobacillus shizuokensis]|uniref:hypothetical protein n=1 Tax=Alicyclobacillus shizuokensis TaxID=392014 RepID=UPI000A4999A5|nr:hypothetical protein [Alicyclobacillus shizuokensis]
MRDAWIQTLFDADLRTVHPGFREHIEDITIYDLLCQYALDSKPDVVVKFVDDDVYH